VLSTKEIAMPVRAGDVIRLESAGGGGWGDPASRPEALEQQDRENGYF
jgi:N-methylhydantoinase B